MYVYTYTVHICTHAHTEKTFAAERDFGAVRQTRQLREHFNSTPSESLRLSELMEWRYVTLAVWRLWGADEGPIISRLTVSRWGMRNSFWCRSGLEQVEIKVSATVLLLLWVALDVRFVPGVVPWTSSLSLIDRGLLAAYFLSRDAWSTIQVTMLGTYSLLVPGLSFFFYMRRYKWLYTLFECWPIILYIHCLLCKYIFELIDLC
jgi:hypothetical protein